MWCAKYICGLVHIGMSFPTARTFVIASTFSVGFCNPFFAAGTVLAMVNTPFILFYSGKMVDPALRDSMTNEVLTAAMSYLKMK
ncbi:MAG: hypothetical protein NTZ74_03215 [Chloroflexi bacterium]|nr:hypothetical protein [Chloroflexota bacterium]